MSLTPSDLFLALILTAVFTGVCGCGEPGSKNTDEKNNGVIVIGDDAGNNARDDAGFADASDGPLTVEPGVVSIAATHAIEVGQGDGQIRVVVPVEIANGLDEAIPVGFNLFRLRVDQLERIPSPESAELPTVCPADSFLSAGMVLSCAVAFYIPEGSDPTALIFQAPEGLIESPVSFHACTRCDGYCVDLETSSAHCGQCGSEIPTGGSCEAGEPKCPEGRYDCQGYCEWTSTVCFLDETTRNSCTNTCRREGLRCTDATYYYECDNRFTEHSDLGCDDVPPASWEACPFVEMNCRCLP